MATQAKISTPHAIAHGIIELKTPIRSTVVVGMIRPKAPASFKSAICGGKVIS